MRPFFWSQTIKRKNGESDEIGGDKLPYESDYGSPAIDLT